MITSFENLPNEILINILEYLASPVSIYHSFKRLNQRFDYILQSIRLNLEIFMEDKQTLIITHYFSAYCNRLRVDNVCPSISLENFSRLRSLTIIEPTDAQINSIQSRTLPMLEYLASPASMIIFDCLFGNQDEQWLYLYSCNFYFTHFPPSKLTWQVNRTLRTCLGVSCSRLTLSQLLSLLPSLRHLRVDMIAEDLSNWNLAIFSRTLQSLRIGFHRLNYDDLCSLISSHLRRLYIDIYDERSSVNYGYLGTLLMSLTTNLKQFNCDYRGIEIPLDEIKHAHRFFENIEFIESSCNDVIRLSCRNMFF